MLKPGPILISPKLSSVYTISFPVRDSGSNISNAGWRSNDVIPASGSLIWGSGAFYNGDYETPVNPAITTNWSIAFQLPYSGSISSITLYDYGQYPGWFFSGSNSLIGMYSGMNATRYGFIKYFYQPPRTLYSGSVYKTTLTFPGMQYGLLGQYIKLHAADGALFDAVGNPLQFTEIEAKQKTFSQIISGSTYYQYFPTIIHPPNITEIDILPRSV